MMFPGRQKQTILIIDDTPDNLRVAVKHFEAYSFEILTARDGETGLSRARLARPDLILLDVQMPGIDGYETCRRLKADPQTAAIPVIFMTVLSEPGDKVRGFEAGGVDYVTKPIEAAELLARVQAHLQIRALREELEQYAAQLEIRVAERTAELERELAQRAAYQKERENLLELVRIQSEHLRRLTQQWIDDQGERDHRQAAEQLRANALLRLSTREYEVLQLMAAGKSNKEIAWTLDVASTYRTRIMEKLEVGDMASLLKLAILHDVHP